MGKNHYIGGNQLLHKGSPLFQKVKIYDLPQTAKRNSVQNYLKDIENIFSNIKILLNSESSMRKDIFQGKLYNWILTIFTIIRKRQSKLRHIPEIENIVCNILIDMTVNERLIKRVQKKVKYNN